VQGKCCNFVFKYLLSSREICIWPWASEGSILANPGFWNLTFSGNFLAEKCFSVNFELVKLNINVAPPPGKTPSDTHAWLWRWLCGAWKRVKGWQTLIYSTTLHAMLVPGRCLLRHSQQCMALNEKMQIVETSVCLECFVYLPQALGHSSFCWSSSSMALKQACNQRGAGGLKFVGHSFKLLDIV